jgi:hypothetical protein
MAINIPDAVIKTPWAKELANKYSETIPLRNEFYHAGDAGIASPARA